MKPALEPMCKPQRPLTSLDSSTLGSGPKLRLVGIIEAQRDSKRSADAEPYYGLDVKKDPLKFKESILHESAIYSF